jgi:hypothetical protein
MTLKLTREKAIESYQADDWSGKLLQNVPLDLLTPHLASATDGFDGAVIAPWHSDTEKNALYSEAIGKYHGMTKDVENAPDESALREYHRFTKGRAALIADQNLRGKQNVMLVFFNEEKNDLHMIEIPAQALAHMLNEQREDLCDRIEHDGERVMRNGMVDDRPSLAPAAYEATKKSCEIFKDMTGISVGAAAMEVNGEDCVMAVSSPQKETKRNSLLSSDCQKLLGNNTFGQPTLN